MEVVLNYSHMLVVLYHNWHIHHTVSSNNFPQPFVLFYWKCLLFQSFRYCPILCINSCYILCPPLSCLFLCWPFMFEFLTCTFIWSAHLFHSLTEYRWGDVVWKLDDKLLVIPHLIVPLFSLFVYILFLSQGYQVDLF